MKRLLLAVLVLPLLLGACGSSSGSPNEGGIWDQSTWDSGATWQP